MRTQLRWIVPLLLAPVVYLACAWGIQALAGSAPARVDAAVGSLGLAVLGFVGPIVLLIIAVVQGVGVYRQARRRRGHFSKAELAQAGEKAAQSHAWENARALRRTLLRSEVPQSLEQWNVPARPRELFFAAVPMTYARYYGQDVHYSTGGGFAYGPPAFVIGALAVTGIANSVARSNVRAAAAEQWREWQTGLVLVSNQRLVVNAGGQWLTFDFGAMTAIYPEVSAQTLVCQFESAAPLLLQGPHAPLAAIMTTFATYGRDGLARHPSLLALD